MNFKYYVIIEEKRRHRKPLLYLKTRWKQMVSFALQPLHSDDKAYSPKIGNCRLYSPTALLDWNYGTNLDLIF